MCPVIRSQFTSMGALVERASAVTLGRLLDGTVFAFNLLDDSMFSVQRVDGASAKIGHDAQHNSGNSAKILYHLG